MIPTTTQRCDLATPESWAIFYNFEMIIALAFSLKTYEASKIRQKVLEYLCLRKEGKGNLFIFCIKKGSIVSLTS